MIDGTRHERRTPDYFPETTRFRCPRDRIIVKVLPLKLSDTIEADWKGKPVRGEVIAVGPGTYPTIIESGTKDGKPYRLKRQSRAFLKTVVKVGDIVQVGGLELQGYLFPRIYIGHEEHILCQEADVCGIETR